MDGSSPYGVAMRGTLFRVVVLALVVAGCTTEGTPATTPSSAPTTTATAVATTATTLPPTTATTVATTTTVDRVVEIEAIFQDLEERRLQALYEGDEETFRSLFANKEYLERSLGAFEAVEFDRQPEVLVAELEIVHEGAVCMAARYHVERLDSGELSASAVVVLEQVDGGWGFSSRGSL